MKTITELVQSLAGAFFKQKYAAPIEEGSTPSRAYAVGELLIHGGQLCKVTSALTTSTTMVIGTNIEVTTISQGLDPVTKMDVDGGNAASHVTFSGAFTTGSRASGSTIGTQSVAEGHETTASSHYSHAEGYLSEANDNCAHAEGTTSKANGLASHAEGYQTTVNSSGTGAHAEGYQSSVVSGDGAHAEGNSSANGDYCHAEGSGQAFEDYAHAEGRSSRAYGTASHAEGYSTTANGNHSHSEGYSTTADGVESHAEGYRTAAQGNHSHAGGCNVTAYLADQFVQGGTNAKFSGSAMTENGRAVFGFCPNPTNYTADTTVTDGQNGCSGTVGGTNTVTINLAVQGLYLIATSVFTISTGVCAGVMLKLIGASGISTGTPLPPYNIYAETNGTASPTVTPAANNQIKIKNTAATTISQFHLIRIL